VTLGSSVSPSPSYHSISTPFTLIIPSSESRTWGLYGQELIIIIIIIKQNFRSLQKKRWACCWFYISYYDFKVQFDFLSCRKCTFWIWVDFEKLDISSWILNPFYSRNGLSSPKDPCAPSCKREVYSRPLLFLKTVWSQYVYVKLMKSAYEYINNCHLQATRTLFLSIVVETFRILDLMSLNCGG
jgi:hypothetical protein